MAEAVVTTQRDHGDRGDRKHAKLKYTIERHGLAWFVAEVKRRAGFAIAPARPFLCRQAYSMPRLLAEEYFR